MRLQSKVESIVHAGIASNRQQIKDSFSTDALGSAQKVVDQIETCPSMIL